MFRSNIGQRQGGMNYEKHLSSFGQRVLSTLITIYSERNLNIRQQISNDERNTLRQSHHKRMITYHDKKESQQQSFEHHHNMTRSFNDSSNVDIVLPTNIELLEPAMNLSIPGPSPILLNKSNIIEDNSKHDRNDNSKQVDWSNFLDSELFPEFDVNETRDNKDNSAIFKLHFPNEIENLNCKSQNEHTMKEKSMKRKNAVRNLETHKKSKVDLNGTLDIKNNFRKKKYTTTVKNWLNDFNCDSLDDISLIQDAILNKNGPHDNKLPEVVIEKTTTKNNNKKKTIQAQLTNKDGIMKYSKPKVIEIVEKPNTSIEKRGNINNDESENKTKEIAKKPLKIKTNKDDKCKERNVKSKFIAPIKSQIPVKDITYDIKIINESNVNECKKHLQNSDSQDAVLTLVYGNGFSQLNSHHTDENCASEGLMLLINNNNYYYFKENDTSYIDVLNEILNKNLISYDAKSVLIYLTTYFDIPISELNLNIFDNKIAASLIEPDNPPENFTELQKLLNFKPEYTIATDCVLQKCAWYMESLQLCSESVRDVLMERELWKLFVDIEMRVLPILAVMEHRGVCVDLEKLQSMESVLLKQMKATELECHKAAGKSFQVNSTVQIGTILYDELQLDTKCNVKIRETICKGAKSTSETMLRSLMSVHPLPGLILEYRHLHKAHATFLAGIVPHVRNGVVKPTWIQTAAATGRIACSNPNLQAVPKAPFSLSLNPTEKETAETLRFRSVYIPCAGHTLLAADFKHVECRVFAHQAADTALLAALASPDLFTELAATWLNTTAGCVSEAERERTKRIVYASLYGAGSRKLMEILDVSYDQALSIVASFNRTFPSLKSFGRWVVNQCEQNGGRVKTASGRTRTFQNINSKDFAAKSQAERQAINFVVQGLAADICKLAMVRTTERLQAAGVCGRVLLQIHDELVWELPLHLCRVAADIIKNTMEQCGREFGITVPLPVALYCGASWGDLVPMTDDDLDHQ